MELTRKQFDILSTLAAAKEPLTQRRLEEMTGNSLGTINKVMRTLTENGLVENGLITADGIDALEPYRAKKSVFIRQHLSRSFLELTIDNSMLQLISYIGYYGQNSFHILLAALGSACDRC